MGASNGVGLPEEAVTSMLAMIKNFTWGGTHSDIFDDLRSCFGDERVKDEIEEITRKTKEFYDLIQNNPNPFQDQIIHVTLYVCVNEIRSKKAPRGRGISLEHICSDVVEHSAQNRAEKLIKDEIHLYIAAAVILDD
jgi:hypothetical protein